VDVLNATARGADRFDMDRLETETDALRDQALALAAELGVDPASWYLRVLEEGRASDVEADLGALVRTYWELQRLTGRSDLRADWRSLADRLWQDA
jgi:CO/xanthine dehydrogenase Mo-binding subunit